MKALRRIAGLFGKQAPDRGGLVQTLRGSPDARARWEAAEALAGSPPEPETLQALAEALGDEHPFVRWKAGEALLSIGGEEVFNLLLELLNRRDATVRAEAAQLLGRLRDPRAVESLSKALKSRNELVRWSAAEALLHLGTKEALDCLRRAAADQAWGVRRAVAFGLGRGILPGEEALPGLIELAKDPHPAVRSAAARALGRLGSPEAEPVLIALAEDPHPQVRAEAVSALGRVGGKKAIALLQSLLEDQEEVLGETVADRAKRALRAIRRRLLLEKLLSAGKRLSPAAR